MSEYQEKHEVSWGSIIHVKLKAVHSRHFSKEKLSRLERDSNPLSPAYRAGALTTEPPKQLSRLACTCTLLAQHCSWKMNHPACIS